MAINKDKSIEEKYIKMSPLEHILSKSSMYIGSIDFLNEKQFIYKNNIIVYEDIKYSPGLYKIIDEIIVNAYDAVIRDNTVKTIEATVLKDSFILYNDGMGIDIVIHPEHKIYVIELLFGNLLSSTNYSDEERVTGGTFGIGVKLANIFANKFIIEVWDKKRKLYYSQTFEKNLSKINKPIIQKQIKDIIGGVKITVFPDFKKFKCDHFSDDMIKLLNRRIIDLTALVRKDVTIYLNNKKLNTGFDKYLELFPSEEKWINTGCVKNTSWEFAIRFNNNKSISSGTHISFVNGINTIKSGQHLNYLLDILLEKFQKIISKDFTKKLLNDYTTICLKTSIINPSFNSQTKEYLMTPPSKFGFECNIPDNFWNNLKQTPIISQLKQVISLSNQKILSKLEGSKKNKIKGMVKLEDANFAGTKKSMDCTLILTEGDSAKASAIAGISGIKDGRNYFGVFPLRGKLLNVREATISQLSTNQEINDIKKIMGLKTGVKREELRYGSILLMMDADVDGSHIKGLFINFIDYFYQHLLHEKDFIKILVTPVVKATYKDKILNFSNLRTYTTWKNKTDSSLWNIKYYKGLGTSTAKESKEYFINLDKNIINLQEKSGDRNDILLAFSKDKIPDRKIWLTNYDSNKILEIEPQTTITVKQFINQELIHFSNYDNIRSIPSLIDGFKPSQRKVIYACLKKNLYNEFKVAQLGGAVAELSAYHHGEQSLITTIINLAQNFVGSNNLNLLEPIGQFGTRLLGGKDHSSARYIFTKLNDHIKHIIKKEDNSILEYLDDDGFLIEPKFYLPIIPLCLINGCEGIGTGFSTFIPCYKLDDIKKWLLNKLNKKSNIKLNPYYNNFTGRIIKYDDTTYISEGICTIEGNKIIISELPIKLWTSDYKDFLEILVEDKTLPFKSYQNLSSDTNVLFIIKIDNLEYINKLNGNIDDKGLNELYKMLHLYKTIKISNLTLYNTKNHIQIYKSVEEILEEFYKFRLEYYEKRRINLIEELENSKSFTTNQINFIELIQKDKKIFTFDEDKLIEYLKNNGIKKINNNYDYVLNLSFRKLNKTSLDFLINKNKEIINKIKELKNKTNIDLWIYDLENI